MRFFRTDFLELYHRHLCRHSQFGINVLHLLAVVGIYFSLFAIAFALPGSPWTVASVLAVYFLLLVVNIPLRVWTATVLVIAILFSAFLMVPRVSVWIYVVAILACHRFQVWNHRIYNHSHPMDAFQEKYRKGPLLFVVLAVYELPILLNYLLFDRRNWRADTLNGPPAAHNLNSEPSPAKSLSSAA